MKNFFPLFLKQNEKAEPAKSSNVLEGFKALEEASSILKTNSKDKDNNHLLRLFDKAIECGLKEGYSQRAFCLQALNYNYNAIADFDIAISYKPYDPNLYFGRGISKKILMISGDAIADLNKAVELAQQKNDLNAEYNLAIQKQGWNSLVEFYKHQLEDAKQREAYLENEIIKKAFIDKLGEQTRPH